MHFYLLDLDSLQSENLHLVLLVLLQYIHLICEINRQSYNQRTNFLIYQFFTICVKMQ